MVHALKNCNTMRRYTGVDGVEHANMAVARANYRDGLVSGLSQAVKEEQKERVRAAKEQDRLRQAELQAKREAKLAKARAEQEVIDAAAAAAGIDPSEIRRAAEAPRSRMMKTAARMMRTVSGCGRRRARARL